MFVQAENAPTNYATSAIAGATSAVQAAPTLLRAMSSIDELNKRLRAVCSQATEIAQAVGGPWPVDTSALKGEKPPQSAMEKLNEGVADAHTTVSNLEGALNAVRRALGG